MAIPRLVCSVFSFQRVTAELDRLSAMNGEKSGDEGKRPQKEDACHDSMCRCQSAERFPCLLDEANQYVHAAKHRPQRLLR